MLHNDSHSPSQSRRLISMAAIAAVAASVVFSIGRHPQLSAPDSSAGSSVPTLTGWVRDDSLPNTAETLSHEKLADEEPAATF